MHILSLVYVVLFIPNPPVYMANAVIKYSNLSDMTGLRVDCICKQPHTCMIFSFFVYREVGKLQRQVYFQFNSITCF